MSHRSGRLLLLAGLVAVLATGCSGGKRSVTASATTASCASAAGLGGTVSDHGSAAAGGSSLAITAGDFFFAPTCESKVPTGTVSLTVRNSGQTLHNVSVAGQGVDQDVPPGKTITVRLRVGDRPLVYVCKYHRTAGMVGALLPARG